MTAPGWDADETVAAWPGLPPLDRDVTADVCVVGLGASGLAAVEAALDRGLSVVGLDAGRVAAGAAGRNGGFLLGGPAPFLHDALARWGDVALDLYRATLAELDRVAPSLPAGVVRRVGSIRVAGWPSCPDPAEAEDVAAHLAALRAHGIAAEPYDGPLGTGVFLPDDAAVNPAVRAVLTAARLRDRGAVLHEHSPVGPVSGTSVATEGGTVTAGAVVVAVDGRLPLVAPAVAGRVRTARLQMLATAPPMAGLVPCPVYGRWGYDYVQQTPDGRLFAGGGRDLHAEDEWTDSSEPTAPVQRHVEGQLVPFGSPPVTHRWAASVGFTDDGRPVCLPVGEHAVAVGGYSGTGNLVGPIAARAALDLALDGTPPPAWLTST